MNKSKEINKTTVIVKDILNKNPMARNSDMYLYIKVCEKVNPDTLDMPLKTVLSDLKGYNLPAFETVRRTRQKIQQCCPELAGNGVVEAHRMLNEEAFKEYARKVMV